MEEKTKPRCFDSPLNTSSLFQIGVHCLKPDQVLVVDFFYSSPLRAACLLWPASRHLHTHPKYLLLLEKPTGCHQSAPVRSLYLQRLMGQSQTGFRTRRPRPMSSRYYGGGKKSDCGSSGCDIRVLHRRMS